LGFTERAEYLEYVSQLSVIDEGLFYAAGRDGGVLSTSATGTTGTVNVQGA